MKVLIIDDEKVFSRGVGKKLEQDGYNVDIAYSYSDFQKAESRIYSLFIVDLSLSDGSGFDIINDIRVDQKLSTPIIIISGHDNEDFKVKGLDSGADDYITKPISPDELLARIRSVMRRKDNIGTTSDIQYKDICFKLSTREIVKGGKVVDFTKKEKQIVEFFLFHKNELISKRQLVESLWNSKNYDCVTDNTINVTIYKVRKKLGENFKLETKIGEGYILEE